MKLKNITIYFPQSIAYLEVGGSILDAEGKETEKKVESIRVFFKKITIKFSTGESIVYCGLPYTTKK